MNTKRTEHLLFELSVSKLSWGLWSRDARSSSTHSSIGQERSRFQLENQYNMALRPIILVRNTTKLGFHIYLKKKWLKAVYLAANPQSGGLRPPGEAVGNPAVFVLIYMG